METNWNPQSFFIGEDIASVHTDKHELQVFAYKYKESETAEYFEMNFGKKEPYDNEDSYDFELIESDEFSPTEANLNDYHEIIEYLCNNFVSNFIKAPLCFPYIKYIDQTNTDSLCLLFVERDDFKLYSETDIPQENYNSELTWELINTLEKEKKVYYTVEIIKDYH
ncbi:hypothetical protein [Enterococcus wangshanyuanii]|nr:hypothetical protein [Enterococcus wangshanyuanii]